MARKFDFGTGILCIKARSIYRPSDMGETQARGMSREDANREIQRMQKDRRNQFYTFWVEGPDGEAVGA